MKDNFWNNDSLDGDQSLQDVSPSQPQRKLSMGSDKDRLAMYQQAGATALLRLYNNDPLIKESIDAQLSANSGKALHKASSIVKRDEHGQISGINHSVMGGVHATTKNQVEVMQAIRSNVKNKFGIKD